MKRIVILILVAITIWPIAATAEDWTVNGKTLHNVVVGNVYADRVEITFDGGVGTPLLKDLSPELQKRFNYDPVAAKAMTQQREQQAAQLDAEMQAARAKEDAANKAAANADQLKKAAEPLSIEVIQVLPNGVLADKLEYGMTSVPVEGVSSGIGLVKSGTTIFVEMPTDGITDNQRITPLAARDGSYAFADTTGARRTVEKWITLKTPTSQAP